MVFLSIIVPVFNSESYVARAIKSISSSILDATVDEEIEVLLIDDGSTDHSVEIMKREIQNKNEFRIIQKEHSGVSATRNLGIREAKGEYLTFFDSDDFFQKGYVTKLRQDAKEFNSDIIIMECSPKIRVNNSLLDDDKRMEIIEEIIGMGRLTMVTNPAGKFFKTDLVKSAHIQYNSELIIGEDLVFILEAVRKAKTITFDSLHFYQIIEHHSIRRYNEYNLKNEVVFNHVLKSYFSNFNLDRDNLSLIKLNLSGFMFVLDWYFNELVKQKRLSFTDAAELAKQFAKSGDYQLAFNSSKVDKFIGRKNVIIRKLLAKERYVLALKFNFLFLRIKNKKSNTNA